MGRKTSLCNDVSIAPSCTGNKSVIHVSLMPLGMKATHDPIVIEKKLWGEVEVPRANEDSEVNDILKHHKVYEITL